MKTPFSPRFLLILPMLILVGCTTGPDFAPVDTPIPPSYTFSVETDNNPSPYPLTPTLFSFGDSLLGDLIEDGITNNLSLAQAAQRIEQAREVLSEANAGFWPNFNASASMRRTWGNTPNLPATATSGGLDASWELDLFGRLRRTAEAADAMLHATELDLEAMRLSLSAEIAATYVSLRATQESLRIAQENLTIQRDTARIARDKTEAGLTSPLDRFSTEAQTQATLSRIPLLEAHIATTLYALEHLTGRYPGTLTDLLTPPQPILHSSFFILHSIGVPSDLLRQRPDIAKAEAQYHAKLMHIGIAKTYYYPSFHINGNASISASALDSWGNAVRTLGLGPAASWNFFSFGRTRARVRQAEAAAEEAAIAYHATVLRAVHEVEMAWVNLDRENARHTAIAAAVENQAKATELAKVQYASGKIDYLNLLNAQTALLAYQEAVTQHDAALALNTILLIKSLGGTGF